MSFEDIELHRELVTGLEYEEWWNEHEPETLRWKRRVLDRDATCILYHECEGDLQAHHVVTQQHLRKRQLSRHAWDRRIGVIVCERGHRRHHSARERIPVDCLPSEVVAFVTELGLDWYLERFYESPPKPDLPSPPEGRSGTPSRARLRDVIYRRDLVS